MLRMMGSVHMEVSGGWRVIIPECKLWLTLWKVWMTYPFTRATPCAVHMSHTTRHGHHATLDSPQASSSLRRSSLQPRQVAPPCRPNCSRLPPRRGCLAWCPPTSRHRRKEATGNRADFGDSGLQTLDGGPRGPPLPRRRGRPTPAPHLPQVPGGACPLLANEFIWRPTPVFGVVAFPVLLRSSASAVLVQHLPSCRHPG